MSDDKTRSRRDSEGPEEEGGSKTGFSVGPAPIKDSEGPEEEGGSKTGFSVGPGPSKRPVKPPEKD